MLLHVYMQDNILCMHVSAACVRQPPANLLAYCHDRSKFALPVSCQVPANDIVERAVASSRDGDFLCPTAQAISRSRPNHEEDTVWKALSGSGLLVSIPCTDVNVGPGILRSHPCYKPQDLLCSVAARGKLDMVFGTPLSTCTLQGILVIRVQVL